MVFAGLQRKGAPHLIRETKGPSLHIHQTVGLKTPFTDGISLPSDVSEAIDVVKALSYEQMVDFRNRRLVAIKSTKLSIKRKP